MAPKRFQKRSPAPEKVVLGDATGASKGERVSEYFDFERFPEKKALTVKRIELAAMLTRQAEIIEGRRWRVRLWNWLRGK